MNVKHFLRYFTSFSMTRLRIFSMLVPIYGMEND